MKQTYYFSHDYNSRNDRKVKNLLMKHGVAGLGVYWCIIEMLYEENGYLPESDCERIAFELRTDINLVKSVVFDFELFEIAYNKFYSRTAIDRLKLQKSKSKKAQESAYSRWKKLHANALRTQSEGNAIKESKVNEKKLKEIKEYMGDKSPTSQKEEKKKYSEYVYLSEKEFTNLKLSLGDGVDEYIERLNGYIGQIGEVKARNKYKSHYHTILNWWRKDGKPKKENVKMKNTLDNPKMQAFINSLKPKI
jgi:hypothetical protein